jgi:hypothetical protein
MDLKAKALLVCEFYEEFHSQEKFDNLFNVNLLGFLVAKQNYCGQILSDDQVAKIENLSSGQCDDWISITWENICVILGGKDPVGTYANISELIASPDNLDSSSFATIFAEAAVSLKTPQQAFQRGRLLEVDTEEMKLHLDHFLKNAEILSDSQRFLLYGYLSKLQGKTELISNLTDHLLGKSNLKYDEQDRSNLLLFLLKYSEQRLSVQNLYPEKILELMQVVDFDNPLIIQNKDKSWNIDFQKLEISETYSDNPYQFINQCKQFLYGDNSSFDFGFESECCETDLIGNDVNTLTDNPDFLPDVDFSDYATFVWSDYWYPKFLLLAYANPANVFIESIDNDQATQWCTGYDASIGISPALPSGMVEIFRFIPRFLPLIASKTLSEHFEEIPDNFINLFKALRHTRPEANIQLRDDVVDDYVLMANQENFDDHLDDFLCEDEKDMTKFFEILAACLYTNNTKLLMKLSLIDDQLTRMCVLLNPFTPNEVIEEMGEIDFELAEDVKFETGFSADKEFASIQRFPEFISAVARNCGDFTFAEKVLERLTDENLVSKSSVEKPIENATKTKLEKFSVSKTTLPTETLIRLLAEFINLEKGGDKYQKFFAVNDIGVALALAASIEWVLITEEGEPYLRETYVAMCALFNADPNTEFGSFDELCGN